MDYSLWSSAFLGGGKCDIEDHNMKLGLCTCIGGGEQYKCCECRSPPYSARMTKTEIRCRHPKLLWKHSVEASPPKQLHRFRCLYIHSENSFEIITFPICAITFNKLTSHLTLDTATWQCGLEVTLHSFNICCI